VNDLITALKELLANQFAMYLKAHSAHWNVEGPMFSTFHEFFQEIYEDVYSSIDPTAEDIRKLRQFPPFTLADLNKMRTVEDDKFSTDPIELSADLYAANERVLESISAAFDAASLADEQGIANFLAERDDMHKKWRWQLKATLKV
jgi:starvation-inducible DNA-binding protein